MLLKPPDDLTLAALKRMRADGDGQRVFRWLEEALADRDAKNRPTIDGVMLRMGQGAAIALAEIIGLATGKQASAGALRDTRTRAGQGGSDTAP